MKTYIKTDFEKGKKFFIEFMNKGSFQMLNLLKFKPIADYSLFPELKPTSDISGEQAYLKYIESVLPLLDKAGSKLLFQGKCSDFVIGPDDEKWDMMLLLQHKSAESFISFADNIEYKKIEGHRTAALEDSRLLPVQG
jgi:uncharacterized protein (DUF1330 family)